MYRLALLLTCLGLPACTPALTVREAPLDANTFQMLQGDQHARRHLIGGVTRDGREVHLSGAIVVDGDICSHWMTPRCLPLKQIDRVIFEETRFSDHLGPVGYAAAGIVFLLFSPAFIASKIVSEDKAPATETE